LPHTYCRIPAVLVVVEFFGVSIRRRASNSVVSVRVPSSVLAMTLTNFAAPRLSPTISKVSLPVRPGSGCSVRPCIAAAAHHADQIRAVNALKALSDHRFDAEQHRALSRQSRELPVPYSLPARITSAVFAVFI